MDFLIIIWLHWLADFVLQTDKMATNKSTSMKWLLSHVSVYSVCLLIVGWKFAIVNGLAHLIIDFFTSKATSYLWKKGDRHNFFVVIGMDQALHLSILYLTRNLFS